MFTSWQIGVILRMSSNVATGMAQVSSATRLANAQFSKTQGIINRNQAAMIRYEERMKAMQMRTAAIGLTVSASLASLGAAFIKTGVSDAAQFERAMTSVQIATGAAGKQFELLKSLAVDTSSITAQSAVTIAEEMKSVAEIAFKDPKQIQVLFPMMAKYADVRFMASGGKENPVETIGQMAMFAHFFSAYTPDKMKKMLDDTAKLQFTTHASLQQLVTQGKYFIPNAVKYGVSESDIMRMLAIGGQTGFLQGRGGTALNNIILRATSTGSLTDHMTKLRRKAMLDLQMFDSSGKSRFIDAEGHLKLDLMIKHLQAMREHFEAMDPRMGGSRWGSDIYMGFDKEAQRFLSVVADATTRKQMDRNDTAMKNIPGVDGQWHKYSNDFFYQFNAFVTNLKNIGMAVFLPTLPRITSFLFNLNENFLKPLIHTLMAHPKLDLGIAITALGGTAAASIYATAMLWKLNAALWSVGGGVVPLPGGGKAAGFLSKAWEAIKVGFMAFGGFMLKPLMPVFRFIGGGFSKLGLVFKGIGEGVSFVASEMVAFIKDIANILNPLRPRGFGKAFGTAFFEDLMLGLRAAIPLFGEGILAIFTAGFAPAVSAILLFIAALDLFKKLPDIVRVIRLWWENDRGAIGYQVGYAFTSLTKMIITALGWLWDGAKSAFLGFITGGSGKAQDEWRKQMEDEIKKHSRDPGFLSSLIAGSTDARAGRAPNYRKNDNDQITMHQPTFYFQMPQSTTKKQVDYFSQALTNAGVMAQGQGGSTFSGRLPGGPPLRYRQPAGSSH